MAEQSPRMEWPFPTRETNPWYDVFNDFVKALDASGYAQREDRQLIMAEGGNVSWTLGTETFAFDDTIIITAPITGFLWQVTAGSFVLTNGQVLYVTLPRAPLANTAVTATVGNTVPSDDDTLILAIRINSRLYLRTGLVLNDGDSVTGISPGAGGGGTLQDAYDGGSPIVLTDDQGAIDITDAAQTAASDGFTVTKDTTEGTAVLAVNAQDGANNVSLFASGKAAFKGPSASDQSTLGAAIHNMLPAGDVLEGGVNYSLVQFIQDTQGYGGDYYFLLCDGNPDGALTIGDPGTFAIDLATGLWYRKTANPSTWEEGGGGGGGLSPMHFQQNGPLASVTTPTDFVDGLREVGSGAIVTGIILSQEIDGTSGNTTIELFKVDPAGVETQITVASSASLAFGGGDKARAVSASFIGTNNELSSNDRLGIKVTSVQGGPAAEITVTVLFGGITADPPPGLPEDDEVTQALLRVVAGTTFDNIGAVYLPAGTITAADSRVFLGTDDVAATAELEIRDAVSASLLATITKLGLPADTQPGGDIVVATPGWYSLRLRSDTALTNATLFGLRFVYSLGNGTRIRQAIDAEVTGDTFENVGSVYLPAGTLQAPGRIFAGATTGPDSAEIELRRETGGTLITTWTAVGTLQEMTLGGGVTIPAGDWYNIRLRGDAGGVVAVLKGIDWTVLT